MTEQEAIKLFKDRLELTDYRKQAPEYYEAMELAVKALEKQIPKTIYNFVDDDTFETSCCGIDITDEDYRYCPECGQLLGEIEEVEE